jgi:hypothetical protein
MSRDIRSKSYKEMQGATVTPNISDPITYIDNGSEVTLKKWDKLDNDDSRRAFLSKSLSLLAKNFSSNWQQVYEVIHLMQITDWFWKEQGFETFEEFWTDRGKFSFEQFRELEHAHLYASMVEPQLFNIDAEKAIATCKMLAKVRAKLPVNHGRAKNQTGCYKKNKEHSVAFDGPSPAEMSDAGEGYNAYGKSGSSGIAYRFARILRDAPHIAKKVKQGHYTKKQKNGKLKVDLEQAEKDAGLWKPKAVRDSVKRTPGERAIDTLNGLGVSEIRTLIDRMSPKLKQNLRKCLGE